MVTKSDAYSSSIDSDTLKRKEITINAYQAYLFYDDKTSAIIWQIGDYVLELFTESSVNEAVKMAESVYFNND